MIREREEQPIEPAAPEERPSKPPTKQAPRRQAPALRRRPAVPKDDAPVIPERSADDSGIGWHDEPDSNDERLRQDVPPHW